MKGNKMSFSTKLTSIAIAATVMVGSAVVANASVIPATDGKYIGDVEKDPFPKDLFGSPALYKCDDIADSKEATCKDAEGSVPGEIYADAFKITFDYFGDGGPVGGTWTFAPTGDETLTPHYMVLKSGGGTDGSVYDISGLTTGAWSTFDHLDGKAISHISFFNTGIPEIPLPAAGFLLIGALGGMGVASRRRKAA